MTKLKITCSVKEPTKNQRRGTMSECAEKKQIRYYGIKKVDKVIVSKLTEKKKDLSKYKMKDLLVKANGLKARAKRLIARIEIAKNKEDKKELKTLQTELEKTKAEYAKVVPIVNKMVREKNAEDAKKKK